MAVKNAVKILISRFGVVWGIMLFVAVYLLILVSFSLIFILPIIAAFRDAGLMENIKELFDLAFDDVLTLNNLNQSLKAVWDSIIEVYKGNAGVKVNTILLITLSFTLLNKFVLGFYEIPIIDVLRHKMSYNATIGFFGRFIANLRVSAIFTLIKMIYTIVADIIIFSILFGIIRLWGINSILTLFLPFIIVFMFILLQALRYSLIAVWTPSVLVDKQQIIPSFFASVRSCFCNFGRTFGGFIIAWTLIFVVNFLFGILTFGAALVLTIPLSMAFICTLNMTIYYSNTGRKYYITNEIIHDNKALENKQ